MAKTIRISPDDWPGTQAELESRIAAFRQAKADHALTEGVPAPREEPLIESVVQAQDAGAAVEIFVPPPAPDPAQVAAALQAQEAAKLAALQANPRQALTLEDVLTILSEDAAMAAKIDAAASAKISP